MNLKIIGESFNIALRSVRSHLLRTILTVLIIAFGIMALISILTAIESIKFSLSENFTRMGSNTFTITDVQMRGSRGRSSNDRVEFEDITWDQATTFKKRYQFPATVSVFTHASGSSTVKYNLEKSNPNVGVLGIDENYMITSGQEIEKGRSFSRHEVEMGRNVTVIGSEVEGVLFPTGENPLGKQISIGPVRFVVVGVMKTKGSGFGFSGDNSCLVPVTTVRRYFSKSDVSYRINVMPIDTKLLEAATGEATGVFRTIRKLKVGQADNFDVRQSDSMVNMLLENIRYVTLAATLIGFITLIGASIGLMNIMLVSVSERTREIGVRKAMGATRVAIRNQFLIESIVVGQMGGLIGILLGVLAGNVISIYLDGIFIVPWGWVILGFTLTLIVGILSGLIPANRAARLDPIESLRYE
ncbi:MAG: ABC transporter permease [Bacteroidales bacterium]|nr:ABC transporter permease [Bacteroidales bacterium]HPE99772.1 ABC transporter permease [Bacteroidales bacterium]